MQDATLESPEADQRLVIESIGSASPGLAGVLANQLGLPTAHVAKALYKAPAVLLDKLPLPQAKGLADILEQAGLQIRVETTGQPLPGNASRLDLAVYLHDPACLASCCNRLSRFLGCSPLAVRNMLMAPPGVVLGDVSPATADALRSLLADLPVELLRSDRQHARYRLVINRQRGSTLNSLLGDLHRQGIEADAFDGTFHAELDYQQGQYLWRRHQSAGGLHMLDTAFMRYDLTLEQVGSHSDVNQLPTLAGLPPELVPCVLENLPVVVEQGISAQTLDARLAAWSKAGMPVTTQVISLRCCEMIIDSCPQPGLCQQLLRDLGLLAADEDLKLPWQSPLLFGELLPRCLQDALEALNADVHFEDSPHGGH